MENRSYITDYSKNVFMGNIANAKKLSFRTSKDVPKFKNYSLRRTQYRMTQDLKEKHIKNLYNCYMKREDLPPMILERAKYLLSKLEKNNPKTAITKTMCEALLDYAILERYPEKRKTINSSTSKRLKLIINIINNLNLGKPFLKELKYIDYANDSFSKITPSMEIYEILPELRISILNSYILMPAGFQQIEKDRLKSLVIKILKGVVNQNDIHKIANKCMNGNIPDEVKTNLNTKEIEKIEKVVFSISRRHRRYLSMSFLCANMYFVAKILSPKTKKTVYKSQKDIPDRPINMLVKQLQNAKCSLTTSFNVLLSLSPEKMVVNRKFLLSKHKDYLELYDKNRISIFLKDINKKNKSKMINTCLKGKISDELKEELKEELKSGELNKLEKIMSSQTVIIPLSTVGYELLNITNTSPSSVAKLVSKVKTHYLKKEGFLYNLSHTMLSSIKLTKMLKVV